MIESSMTRASQATGGILQGADATFRGVSTDTRSLSAGELFVALQGPNFDGAAFADKAAELGAAGIIAQREVDTGIPSIVVDDTRAALGQLAADWRAQSAALVIGVTGSNGKTTLKELLASCLRPVAATLATEGNLNNDIGLPLMMLRLSGEHEFAVFEMGANHAGEIAYLTSLAAPAIVVISNAGPAHLEGFGSLDGVAKAKGEILQGQQRPATAVLNADDVYFDYWQTLVSDVDVLSFGLSEGASVRAVNVRSTGDASQFDLLLDGAELGISLPLAGAHNVVNACAAAAVALAAKLSPQQIKAGLESVRPVDGRLRPIAGRNGTGLYDDSYNANPASVVAAASFVAAQDGESWLVLGDMGELGNDEAAMHRSVGEASRAAGVDRLFATGPLTKNAVAGFGNDAAWFGSVEELIETIQADLPRGANILVKGSRVMRMERVIDALRADKNDKESN